jgi:ankyrin repeat protein
MMMRIDGDGNVWLSHEMTFDAVIGETGTHETLLKRSENDGVVKPTKSVHQLKSDYRRAMEAQRIDKALAIAAKGKKGRWGGQFYPVIMAVGKKNELLVGSLQKSGFNMNEQQPSTGRTPLHRACEKRYYNIVVILMHGGADPRIKDKEGLIPIMCLVSESLKSRDIDDNGIMKMLLSEHMEEQVKTRDKGGKTLLHYVVRANSTTRWCRILITAGASLQIRMGRGRRTALMTAAKTRNDDYVMDMIKAIDKTTQDFDPNVVDGWGDSMLHYTTRYGLYNSCWWLINYSQVDIQTRNKANQTALYLAARNGRKDMVKSLLQAGGTLQEQAFDGYPPGKFILYPYEAAAKWRYLPTYDEHFKNELIRWETGEDDGYERKPERVVKPLITLAKLLIKKRMVEINKGRPLKAEHYEKLNLPKRLAGYVQSHEN